MYRAVGAADDKTLVCAPEYRRLLALFIFHIEACHLQLFHGGKWTILVSYFAADNNLNEMRKG